jgi:ABC-type lipoprotein export system ATPase subunit
MLDTFLLPETTVEKAGESAAVAVAAGQGKTCLLTMAITKILEQQSLDVSVWGSANGTEWAAKPLTAFPQKFYQGIYQQLLDLSKTPDVQFLKLKWAVNRWGVGDPKPQFTFLVKIQEQA